MNKSYDLVLLGATALAAGIVQAHPQLRIAVLEQSCSVAGEFVDAMKTGTCDYSAKTIQGADLCQQLRSRNALTEKGLWLPAAQPVLSHMLLHSSTDVYFFAAVTRILPEKHGYQLHWCAFGMAHAMHALAVVDTTENFISHGFFGCQKPTCTYTLNHMDTDHKIHTTPCTNAAQGRKRILQNYKDILRIAPRAAAAPNKLRQDIGAAAWIPSSACDNLLAAFDEGAAAALPQGSITAQVPTVRDLGTYDVIVVGLGTAGSIAAITAQQTGLKVLGIENLQVCGGAGTAGNVLGYYFGYKGGIYQQIDQAGHQFDDRFIPMQRVGADQKITQLNESLAGCDVYTDAVFTGALTVQNRVEGITFQSEGSFYRATAKFVIDATAEAAVCISAGCEMLGGRSSDGQFQPYSCLHLKHTDGKLLSGSMDQGRINQYDPDSLGQGILSAHSSYLHLLEDYADETYLGIVPLIGLREGLRIVGEQTVQFSDLIAGQFHKDPVYYCWSNFDNHGKDIVLESREYRDWITLCGLWGWGLSIPIPMGALIPKNWDGLLAAGRCVSVDHDTAFAVRMKDDVQKCGEAAAQLAYIAISQNTPAREVSVVQLREKLFATGCLKETDEIPRIEKQRMGVLYQGQLWCNDDAALKEGLNSHAPGYYMWSARVLEKRQLLTALLDSPEENARFNAALTLALLNDASDKVLEQLKQCALKQDGYIPVSGRKYVYPRAIAAIYAMERLRSAAALPALYQLMENERFIGTLPLEISPLLSDREDYYFQYRSHILCALCRIAQANPALAQEIQKKLQAYLKDKTLSVTLMGSRLRYDDTDVLTQMVNALA